MSTQSSNERYDFLDWLRVIAIFVLLFFHTGMLFVGWGWHITNAETIRALELPMDLSHRLRMPLLFVVAGAAMWFALQRRSGSTLIRERTWRLIVPVIFGMLVIVPPQIFVERVVRGQWHGGYFTFLFERVFRFEFYPAGDFGWHHLWFIVYLYVYVVLLTPLLLWWRGRRTPLRPGAWLYLLALPLGLNEALLKPLFPETHTLVTDWYIFVHYLLLTVYGFLLASIPGAWDWLAARRHVSLALGLTVIIGLLTSFNAGVIAHDSPTDHVVANVFTWLWLMVFIGYGRQHLNFANRLLVWARDASYPIYILHQTVIVVIAYFVVRQPWHPWTKYFVVLGSTMLICVLLYESLVRRFAVLRLVFGMRSHSNTLTRAGSQTPPWAIAARDE